jgi:predicted transcriptional regulator
MNTHSDKSFTQNDLTDILTEVYIDENTAIDKRLKEQTISGNVTTDGDRYQISQQGKLIMDFYIKVADLFNVDKKNLSK